MKSKSLMILLIILAALVCGYFGVTRYLANKSSAAKDTASITVSNVESVVKLTYASSSASYTYVKDNGVWYYDADRNFPVSQYYLDTMASEWGQADADRELVDGDSASAYGLDTPAYTIELTDDSGSVTTLYVGSAVGSDYYVSTGDKSKIYTVSSQFATYLSYTPDKLIQVDTFPSVTSSTLKSVEITAGTAATSYNSDDDAEAIAGIAGGLSVFSTSKYASYYTVGDGLAAYGLDESSRTTVKFTYTKNDTDTDYTMYIGSLDSSGSNYYVQLQDSSFVYTESASTVANILDTNSTDKSGTDTGTVTDSSASSENAADAQ